jgi:hypothetical protein
MCISFGSLEGIGQVGFKVHKYGGEKKYLVSPGYRTNLEYVKLGIKQSHKLNKVVRIRPPPLIINH